MKSLKLILLTICAVGMMSAQARFASKKVEKNSYDELRITLPHYIDSTGKKYYFSADYQTAENLCQYLGKQRHHEYDNKTQSGKTLVAQNSVRYTFDNKMKIKANQKNQVIYSIHCSGQKLSSGDSEFSVHDENQIKRSVRNWSVLLGL